MSDPEPRSQDGQAQELRSLVDLVARIVGRSEPPTPPVLRVKEVAERLGIGERAVRDQMDRGELPWAWQGRQRVVPLQVWLDRLAAQAKSNEPPWTR